MNIERRPIAELLEAPYNPRKISDEAMAKLRRSIEEFGLVEPVVVNSRTGRVVGGHQRLKVLRERGNAEVECVVVDLDERREKALNVALNNPNLAGEWDMPALAGLLEDVDLGLTGFDEEDIADLFGHSPEAIDDDRIPRVLPESISRLGDLWQIGDHRLLCGDATVQENYERLGLRVEPAGMVFTDPPYGVSYEASNGKFEVIEGDHRRDDELMAELLVPSFKAMASHARDEAAFYIWHASSTREDFAAALKASGLMERQYIIWAKEGVVLGHADYLWAHEPCFYASKAGKKAAFYAGRDEPTVWQASCRNGKEISTIIGPGVVLLNGCGGFLMIQTKAPKQKRIRKIRIQDNQLVHLQQDGKAQSDLWQVANDRNYQHPTQKPVELAVRAIRNSSRPGDVVLDPFIGGGTTLIASEKLRRKCRGMEIDPKYCDVVVKRWQQFTGKQARNLTRPEISISMEAR